MAVEPHANHAYCVEERRPKLVSSCLFWKWTTILETGFCQRSVQSLKPAKWASCTMPTFRTTESLLCFRGLGCEGMAAMQSRMPLPPFKRLLFMLIIYPALAAMLSAEERGT